MISLQPFDLQEPCILSTPVYGIMLSGRKQVDDLDALESIAPVGLLQLPYPILHHYAHLQHLLQPWLPWESRRHVQPAGVATEVWSQVVVSLAH